MKNLAIILVVPVLFGCVSAQQRQLDIEDPVGWGRFDCERVADRPELHQVAEQAKAICGPRAEAAAIAGTAAMPSGYGLGGAIAAGVNQGMTARQINDATLRSCMAEQGYVLSRKSEFDARCPAKIVPAPVVTSSKRKG